VGRVLGRGELREALAEERRAGRTVVFTNGCFDLLHPGHVRSLREARGLGDRLVVGVNSDRSVGSLGKGPGRPIFTEDERAEVLAALDMVDYVTLFDENTPLELIHAVEPDVLVKGGDWREADIVGAEFVRRRGGRVERMTYHPGMSTTEVLRRIRGT
jgi:D-beta-D-heptose 7-phosphate kinase/D-beta-D-heptose 1-phosphate adenosyltransferase